MTTTTEASVEQPERKLWMDRYVARMVEQGIEPKDAWACCRGGEDDHDYSSDPSEAADDELSCWGS
jgi:hypothetical protein